ncbi:MAG: GntR family transcriptional regulator [Oscillospiraceae bacterium]|nr:GntR family transcriptional regulator [Oscillospiraceae bacterium]
MNKTSKRPIYLQLKEKLFDRISSQEWKPGDCLPSERALCEEYTLSRMTVRQAVAELEREGVVTRVQGKGTFVAKEKLMQPLLKLTSFSEDMRLRGLLPGAQTLALEKVPANKAVAEKLAIAPGDEVILLKRLRLADGEPMAIETAYLNSELCAPIYDQLAENKSLYQLMKRVLHITLSGARQSIEIAPVQSWEAKLLRMPETGMVMKTERQTLDTHMAPVEYVISKYRGDRYKFYIELFE